MNFFFSAWNENSTIIKERSFPPIAANANPDNIAHAALHPFIKIEKYITQLNWEFEGFKSNSTNLLLLIMDLGVWTQIGLCQFLHFIFPPIRYKLLYSIMQVSRYFQSNDSEMYSQCDLKMEKSTIYKKRNG